MSIFQFWQEQMLAEKIRVCVSILERVKTKQKWFIATRRNSFVNPYIIKIDIYINIYTLPTGALKCMIE